MNDAGATAARPVGQRPLGRTGRNVSELGLGCASYWARPGFAEKRARAVFDAALECGITLFDTGGSYAGGEAERRLGRMVKASGGSGEHLLVATKVGTRNAGGRVVRDFSPGGIVEQVHASLQRLGLERIPLLQLHGPEAADITDELLAALDRLRNDGKVQLVGVNARGDGLDLAVGHPSFDVVMPFVSVLEMQDAGPARRAAAAGQGVLVAEPLARMRFAPPPIDAAAAACAARSSRPAGPVRNSHLPGCWPDRASAAPCSARRAPSTWPSSPGPAGDRCRTP